MIATLAILTLFGFGGGYLAGHADLWEDWRGRSPEMDDPGSGWLRRKDENYGRFMLAKATGSSRYLKWWWLVKGKFFHAITCATCAGWHAAWIALLIWSQLGTLDIGIVDGFVLWIAASAAHTFLMAAYEKLTE